MGGHRDWIGAEGRECDAVIKFTFEAGPNLLRLRFWAVAPRVVFKRHLGCGFGLSSGGLRSTPQSSAGRGREAGVSHQFVHSFYRYPNLY